MKMNNMYKNLLYATVAVGGLALGGHYMLSGVTLAIARAANPTATVYMTAEVSNRSVEKMVERIHEFSELGAKHILLEINSLGGSVLAGKQIQSTMRNLGNVDVYIPGGMAASMAAEIWMSACHRYVEEDSEVLFHGAAVGNGVREPEMEVVVRIIKGEEVIQDDPQLNYSVAIGFAAELISAMGRPMALTLATEILTDLAKINRTGVENFRKVLADAGVVMTYEQVKKKFYGDFKKDMTFSGKELAELGLASLGRPDSSKYRY